MSPAKKGKPTTYVALIRGLNVGRSKRVPMAELRRLLDAAPALAPEAPVRTYVQSGNVVLRSAANAKTVAAAVREQLAAEFELDNEVIVRTAAELADVAAHNPFLSPDANPRKQLLVAFLATKPAAAAVKRLDPHRAPPDELHVRGREIYLWCPDGWGNSKVMNGVERIVETPVTTRNWRTVGELLRLADDER